MLTLPDYKVLKWRYLDSLDSAYYSKTNLEIRGATKSTRLKQASIELSATILLGNGITVPANQFIDSLGFLRIASEMIQAFTEYKGKGKPVFLPLQYAFYDYGHEKHLGAGPHLIDPFLLTAYLLNKDGTDHNGYFELSAWTELNQEVEASNSPNLKSRRRKWAKELSEHCMAIPNKLIKDKDPYEPILAHDLIMVLKHFNINRGSIIPAAPTKGIREEMVRYVSNLSLEKMEKDKFVLTKFLGSKRALAYKDKLIKIMDIANVCKKLEEKVKNGKHIIDNRSDIREELFKNEAQYFDGDQSSIRQTRVGVLETIDSIYNFSGYKSTYAVQDNHSEPMEDDTQWGYDEAAFALGSWTRERYQVTHGAAKDDISSTQDMYINPTVGDSSFVTGDFDEFWRNFFDFQSAGEWNESLNNYQKKLNKYEEKRNQFQQLPKKERTKSKELEVKDKANKYREARDNHIIIVNKFLDKHKYQILVDKDDKAILAHYINGEMESKTQIEDFAENALLSRGEKRARYARKTAKDISVKSQTAEYDK